MSIYSERADRRCSGTAGRPGDGDAELLVGRHHPPVPPGKELEHRESGQVSERSYQVEASIQTRNNLLGKNLSSPYMGGGYLEMNKIDIFVGKLLS